MSDLHLCTEIATFDQRFNPCCSQVAALAAEYELIEELATVEPRIKALRRAKGDLMSAVPDELVAAASGTIFKAAIPVLEDVLRRLDGFNKKLAAVKPACEGVLDGVIDEMPEARSEALNHEHRDVFLKSFGLMGLMYSLEDSENHISVLMRTCLEQATSESVGTVRWAEMMLT